MNTQDWPLPVLPPRAADSHKGDYGRALIIGGSRGMSGAVSLAGQAALRGGAGLVTLAVPDACLDSVASLEPAYMTFPLPNDDQGRLGWAAAAAIEQRIGEFTAAAIGPGLGRSDDLVRLVSHLYQSVTIPLVVDADGLNALAACPEALFAAAGPRVLTPHPGEFRRLAAAVQLSDVPIDQQAIQLSLQSDAVIVLKSHHTLTIDQDRQARNNTGNPGMATGGSGDVLTGVITALICQGLEPFDAARLAVHVHGLAGDLAAAQLGQVSMIATDLNRYLPAAFLQLESGR